MNILNIILVYLIIGAILDMILYYHLRQEIAKYEITRGISGTSKKKSIVMLILLFFLWLPLIILFLLMNLKKEENDESY